MKLGDITEQQPDNIVALFPGSDTSLEITAKRLDHYKKCIGRHKHVQADGENRTLQCTHCGYVVDPFDYVMAWAMEGEHRMGALKQIEHQRKIAQAEHDDLMRKVKNMREQLKRAGMPQPPKERDAFNVRRWNPRQEGTPHQAVTP